MMDSANKRASAIGIALATRLILPFSDGAVNQPDRQQVAYSYAGITAAQPVIAPAELITLDLAFRRTVLLDLHFRRQVHVELER